jgi:ABC-2 type transport system permease protein
VTGFGLLLRKELLESWRTRRLWIIAALFAILGMISPLTARYLPDILKATLGDQLTIPVPSPTSAMALEQLQKNLGQMGALAAIALAMSSVAGELDRGTAALVLAQPVTRTAFLAAKLTAIGIILAVSTLLAVGFAWAYTAVLFEPGPAGSWLAVGGWLAMAGLSWLALLAWASLTFLASALTGSTTAAAGLGFVGLVAISLAAIVPAFDRLLPSGLAVPAMQLAAGSAGDVDTARLATAVAGTLAIIVASLAGALAGFRRREL